MSHPILTQWDVKFCWKCGTEQQPEKSRKDIPNLCPLCNKNDKVAKVSAIVSHQTHQLHGTTSEWIVDDDGGGRWSDVPFSGIQQSELAQKLSLPHKPESKSIWGWTLIPLLGAWALIILWFAPISKRKKFLLITPTAVFVVSVIIFASLTGLDGSKFYNYEFVQSMCFVMFFVALFIMIIMYYSGLNDERIRRKKHVKTVEVPLWEKAVLKWEKLYYCFRDDCVFEPKTTKHAPAEMMNDLLGYAIANDSLAE